MTLPDNRERRRDDSGAESKKETAKQLITAQIEKFLEMVRQHESTEKMDTHGIKPFQEAYQELVRLISTNIQPNHRTGEFQEQLLDLDFLINGTPDDQKKQSPRWVAFYKTKKSLIYIKDAINVLAQPLTEREERANEDFAKGLMGKVDATAQRFYFQDGKSIDLEIEGLNFSVSKNENIKFQYGLEDKKGVSLKYSTSSDPDDSTADCILLNIKISDQPPYYSGLFEIVSKKKGVETTYMVVPDIVPFSRTASYNWDIKQITEEALKSFKQHADTLKEKKSSPGKLETPEGSILSKTGKLEGNFFVFPDGEKVDMQIPGLNIRSRIVAQSRNHSWDWPNTNKFSIIYEPESQKDWECRLTIDDEYNYREMYYRGRRPDEALNIGAFSNLEARFGRLSILNDKAEIRKYVKELLAYLKEKTFEIAKRKTPTIDKRSVKFESPKDEKTKAGLQTDADVKKIEAPETVIDKARKLFIEHIRSKTLAQIEDSIKRREAKIAEGKTSETVKWELAELKKRKGAIGGGDKETFLKYIQGKSKEEIEASIKRRQKQIDSGKGNSKVLWELDQLKKYVRQTH